MKKQQFTTVRAAVFLLTFTSLFFNGNAQNEPNPKDTIKHQMPEVEVFGSLGKSMENIFSATTLNKQNIQENLGNGSINNIFDLIPSMITTSDAGTGVGYTYMRIRGVDQTRINVTMNGVAINDAESQGSWLVNLPDLGNNVGSLNVQRGVGNSSNGSSAFGASMNFATMQSGTKPFLEISSGVGSFQTFRNSITAGSGLYKDRVSVLVSYSNILSNGYINYSKARLNSLFFNTDIKLNKKNSVSKYHHSLVFNLFFGDEKTGLAWNGVPSNMLESDRRYNSCGEYFDENGNALHYDNETDNYTQTHFQLFYKIVNSKSGYFLNIGTHLTRGFGYYEQYKEDKKYSAYGLPNYILNDSTIKRSDFITQKWLDNYFYGINFSTGKSVKFANANSLKWNVNGSLNQYDGEHYGKLIWSQNNSSIPQNYEWYYGTGKKTQGNVAGNLAYQIKKWTLFAELQYRLISYKIGGIDDDMIDISQYYFWNFFNPKTSISYNWSKNKVEQSLYFSFAMANREPTRSDIVDAPLLSKPVPETLYDFELGYLLNLEKYRLNVNGYFMYYDHQLVLTGQINDVGAAIMSNVDKSYRAGIEVVSHYQPNKYFTWNFNTTLSANKILDYTQFVETYDENWEFLSMTEEYLGTTDISFSPNIVVGNEFIFTPIKSFNIGLATKFIGKQYIDNSSNENYILKPYTITNLNLSYQFKECKNFKVSIFFSINNIFNAKYESNAWLWKAYVSGVEQFSDGYYPQAGINFFGGIKVRL
ncbi:MAG TPA: TonB-dependent receptor plug domain-containing protein [Bacteroidales bacterium]|nr:TonB-dependent receptor plug domain-containing protein [Bacteroidales bacterium]